MKTPPPKGFIMATALKIAKTVGWLFAAIFASTALYTCVESALAPWQKQD